MPSTAELSRSNPTCLIFLIDQSSSMAEPFGAQPVNRCQICSSQKDLTPVDVVLPCCICAGPGTGTVVGSRSPYSRLLRSGLEPEPSRIAEVAVGEPVDEAKASKALESGGHGRNADYPNILVKPDGRHSDAEQVGWEGSQIRPTESDCLVRARPAQEPIGCIEDSFDGDVHGPGSGIGKQRPSHWLLKRRKQEEKKTGRSSFKDITPLQLSCVLFSFLH
jgi:hypothetical protein